MDNRLYCMGCGEEVETNTIEREGKPPGAAPDFDDLTPELKDRLLRLVPKLIELGMGCTYSAEAPVDSLVEDNVDCARQTPVCRSVCCSFRFALTREEADGGVIMFDPEHPYFIARGPDGYCAHLDREERRCTIWRKRPLRCRRYSCLTEGEIWRDVNAREMLPGAFDHLPRPKSYSR